MKIGHFEVFDATALHDWLACPELFRQRHVLGLRAERPEEAADAGSAFHKGVEAWYATHDVESAVAALRAAWGPTPLVEMGKRTSGHYIALLRAYCEQPQNFKVVRNESFLQADLAGLPYKGRVDRIIQLEDGSRYVMDLKTTSRYLNEAYFAAYALDFQLIGYTLLARASGEEVSGAFVDAVHIDTRYQKVKPEHFRKHGPLTFPKWKEQAFLRTLAEAYESVEIYADRLGVAETWPQNPRSCWRYNQACPFWARCTSPPEVREALPGYIEEPWRPEP